MLKYSRKEWFQFLGYALIAWYTDIRWFNQGNTLCTSTVDAHGKTTYVLAWIFAPINLATAFVTIYFVGKVLIELNKSFTPIMGLIAFLLGLRNVFYALEDYRDFVINPTKLQLFFIGLDLAMVVYVLIWSYLYWRMKYACRHG